MSDMRQKLLPVFLEEAGRKILQLDAFFAAVGGESKSLADLEAAFRAAHTLKGTAALVQAESVRSLSGRMEGLLEGHFAQGRFPSEIEYEAMQLALDHLRQLIDAIATKQAEPAGLLAEADLALRLAMAMPGRRQLTELLGPNDSEDPFAEDPDIDGLTASPVFSTEVPEDPFADDPDLDQSPADIPGFVSGPAGTDPFADDPEIEHTAADLTSFVPAAGPVDLDPFADDPELDVAFAEELPVPVEPLASFADINDPFADDPELEYVQAENSRGLDDTERDVSPVTGQPSLRDQGLVAGASAEVVPASQQEDSFIDRMRKRIENESPLQTAERLAKTLLSQDEGDAVARQYSCCQFRVASKDYYLPIANMLEISDLPAITHLPLAPTVVRGLINLRGHVLPVIDLGFQSGGTSQYVAVRKLVIAEAAGEKLAFLSDGIPNLSEDILGERVDVIAFVDQFRAGAS